MDPTEREQLLQQLNDTHGAMRQATAGLSEAQAAFAPSPDRWSARDCAEHVAVAEDLMFLMLTKLRRAADPGAADRSRDRMIATRLADRTRKNTAPEPARPAGRFPSLEAAVAHFEQGRARTIAYVESCADDLRAFTVNHPVAGIIDCYQHLLVMAGHPARHALQIQELRSQASFPKG